MDIIAQGLPWIQITLAILLVIAIILQQSGAGLGGAFGGSDSASINHTRRGGEKVLFQATIVLGILFALSVFLSLFLS